MAKKKNVPARKPTVRKAVRKTVTKTAAISAGRRIQTLERRLRELEQHPALGLAGVIVLEKKGKCTTVKVIGNLQIVNGMGSTNTTNGCGNLLIGYNEPPPPLSGAPSTRTGSHNIILGRFHSHASYAGLLAGEMNVTMRTRRRRASSADPRVRPMPIASWSSAASRTRPTATAASSSAASTTAPTAESWAVVVGGVNNRADAPTSSIFGGTGNTTGGANSTILGGSSLATTLPGERIP